MLEPNGAARAQPTPTPPAAVWEVQQRVFGTMRVLGVYSTREDAAEFADGLRERGLDVLIAWRRG